MDLLEASATNPFMFAPPLLGYENFDVPQADILWYRTYGQSVVGSGHAVIVVDPATAISTAGASYGATASSFVNYIGATSTTAALSTYASYPSPAINVAPFLTRVDVSRSITAAARVTVRYASTSVPGRLFALCLNVTAAELGAMTITDLLNLDATAPVAYDGSGMAVIQGNWRQHQAYDFAFSEANAAIGASFHSSKIVIVATGWPTAFVSDLEVISHEETQSGELLNANPVTTPTLSLTQPIERVAARMRSVPLCLDKESIMACNRAQLLRAIRWGAPPAGPMLSSAQEDYVQASSSMFGEAAAAVGEGIRSSVPNIGRRLGSFAATMALNHALRSGRGGHLLEN